MLICTIFVWLQITENKQAIQSTAGRYYLYEDNSERKQVYNVHENTLQLQEM